MEPLQFIFAKPKNPALGWFPEQKIHLELNHCKIQLFSLRSIFTFHKKSFEGQIILILFLNSSPIVIIMSGRIKLFFNPQL